MMCRPTYLDYMRLPCPERTSEYETVIEEETYPRFRFHNMFPHNLLAPIRPKRATFAPAADDDCSTLESQMYHESVPAVHASVVLEVSTQRSAGFCGGFCPPQYYLRHRRIENYRGQMTRS